jgi:hypothetical protein
LLFARALKKNPVLGYLLLLQTQAFKNSRRIYPSLSKLFIRWDAEILDAERFICGYRF